MCAPYAAEHRVESVGVDISCMPNFISKYRCVLLLKFQYVSVDKKCVAVSINRIELIGISILREIEPSIFPIGPLLPSMPTQQ